MQVKTLTVSVTVFARRLCLHCRYLGTTLSQRKADQKIQGTKMNYYRLRVDKYRVFYMLEGNRVVILRILSKKDVERFIRSLD